jgi:hypothetical protein
VNFKPDVLLQRYWCVFHYIYAILTDRLPEFLLPIITTWHHKAKQLIVKYIRSTPFCILTPPVFNISESIAWLFFFNSASQFTWNIPQESVRLGLILRSSFPRTSIWCYAPQTPAPNFKLCVNDADCHMVRFETTSLQPLRRFFDDHRSWTSRQTSRG